MTIEELAAAEEAAYLRGRKAVRREQLSEILREFDGEDLTAERILAERADAIATLRQLCGDYGDNDWDDNLRLSDIIEKHLGNHLHEQREHLVDLGRESDLNA